jgi:hypothetical protein
MKTYTNNMTIDERLEIIRETLKQGWSSHYAFRMGKVSRKEMPYFRERLADEILAYNKTRHNFGGVRIRTK